MSYILIDTITLPSMKKIIAILLFMHFINTSFSQKRDLRFALRFPIQYELQKAIIPFTWGNEIQKARAINFGLDALMNYKINNFSIYTGAGFFRNRFNIKRGYDHQALNKGRDSLPIGTQTHHYTYSLLRLPLGVRFEVAKIKNVQMGLGLEHLLNFSFCRKYKGTTPPIEDFNNTYKHINYFGNSANFLITISRILQNKNSIQAESYVRILNKYKKDRFLKENENENVTRNIDAFGVGIKYTFTLKK